MTKEKNPYAGNIENERIIRILGDKAMETEKFLERFWGKKRAVDFMANAYSVAVELDGLVDRIRHNPEMMQKYEYSAGHFIDRNTKEEYFVPDGAYLLNLLRYLFRNEKSDFSAALRSGERGAVNELVSGINSFPGDARTFVENWSKSESVVADTGKKSAMFEFYEKQMKEFIEGEKNGEIGDEK